MTAPDQPITCCDPVPLAATHDRNARRTLWVVALTAVMMVAEIVAGSITGSMALLADGFHMATHAGALGVAAAAYAYAKRHARSGKYSFGTGKVGDLAGFASALMLGIVAIGIGVESAMRLFEPRPVAFGEATLVAVLGLVVNIVSAALLAGGHDHAHGAGHDDGHGHDHAHGGSAHGSDNNMRSAYAHVLADALTSILAIVALLAGRYLGWVWLDPAIGIVGALVIAHWARGLLRDTAAVLLDRSDAGLTAKLRRAIEGKGEGQGERAGDVTITDLHVWPIGGAKHAAIVVVASSQSAAAIRARAAGVAGIAHLTVACDDRTAGPAR